MKSPSDQKISVPAIKGAFGAANRARLIGEYFKKQKTLAPESAWKHIYRLLLWADQTNGLAHCYESDKSQPGKPWYARSLAFHDFVAKSLKVDPAHLAEEIDWLFRRATADLAAEAVKKAHRLTALAAKQREPFDKRGLPMPGDDPELQAIVKEVLGDHLKTSPSEEKWRTLIQRVRQYLMLENKRKNLVGEGFEDVLSEVIRRSPGAQRLEVRTRCLLHDLPGFNRTRQGEKPNKVDLAILRSEPRRRTLATVKWSVRADREKQFAADFSDYVQAESEREPFEYVFVTNEFDPARLMRACETLAANAHMFTCVVHINPSALKAAYGPAKEESQRKVLNHIESGRLISLENWLKTLLK